MIEDGWKDSTESKEEEEMRYNTIDEVPDWGKDTIQKLINKGYLIGYKDGNGTALDLTTEMIRMFVIHDRAGLYDLSNNVLNP